MVGATTGDVSGKAGVGASILAALALFALSSSGLLVTNKWALLYFPFPWTLMGIQFAVSAVVAFADARRHGGTKVSLLSAAAPWAVLVAVLFLLSVAAGVTALKCTSVAMLVLFRALTTVPLALFDFLWLRLRAPSWRSILSLVAVVIGGMRVVVSNGSSNSADGGGADRTHSQQHSLLQTLFPDSNESLLTHILETPCIGLLLIYVLVCTTDAVVCKVFAARDSFRMETRDRVLYTNALSALPALLIGGLLGEWESFSADVVDSVRWRALLGVALSSALGVTLTYSAWYLRGALSTLSYTLMSLSTKVIAVALSAVLFGHLSLHTMTLVCITLLSASMYEEPRARDSDEAATSPHGAVQTDLKRFVPHMLLLLFIGLLVYLE